MPMLDIILVFFTIIVALILRAEPLRRLRPLTLPLLLTAAAALAHVISQTLVGDEDLTHLTSVALVLSLAFLVARGALLLTFDWVMMRRMGVSPPRLMREVVALLVYLGLAAIILRTMNVEVTGLVATSAVITVVVGLALQQTLRNLLAGLALAWEQRLTIGTWVEMDDEVGLIEQTGWRSLVFTVAISSARRGFCRKAHAPPTSAPPAGPSRSWRSRRHVSGRCSKTTSSSPISWPKKMAIRQLEEEELRDETGALISPAGLVAQFRQHLLKIIGR